MALTVDEIATKIDGKVIGLGSASIDNFLDISEAPERFTGATLVLALDKNQKEKLAGINPGVIVTDQEVADSKTTQIIVNHDKEVLIKLLDIFYPADNSEWIAEEAIISKSAKTGKGCRIYPGVVIGENVEIGDQTIVYPNVVIYEKCIIGSKVIIQANTSIGSDGFGYVLNKDGTSKKVPQRGNVVLEENVEVGANCAIDRAVLGSTTIGQGTKIDNHCHIAHNCKIGSNCMIAADVVVAGSCTIGNNVMMSGKVGIIDHIKVGDGAVLLARTTVVNDLEGGKSYAGRPARESTHYNKVTAIINKLPEVWSKIKKLLKE